MVRRRESIVGQVVFVILVLTVAAFVIYQTTPGNPTINVPVINNGRLLQNITVSCFQCVPFARDKWEGVLTYGGVAVDVSYYGSGSSVGMKFNFALPSEIAQGSYCVGLVVNSTCLNPIDLPYSFGIHIQKTSSGGYLQAKVYLNDGEWFLFRATSGGLDRVFHLVPV
jgi:hypothetical protein